MEGVRFLSAKRETPQAPASSPQTDRTLWFRHHVTTEAGNGSRHKAVQRIAHHQVDSTRQSHRSNLSEHVSDLGRGFDRLGLSSGGAIARGLDEAGGSMGTSPIVSEAVKE
jgi:hypothetical protein